MDRRLFWCFCVLTALRSARAADPPDAPKIIIDKGKNTMSCDGGVFSHEPGDLKEDMAGTFECVKDGADGHSCSNENCVKIAVKVLSGESLIQVSIVPLVGVLIGNIAATAMIGWAVYSICAQPRVRSSYQGSKASDRVNLINNHSSGDTYQPLNTRPDEYSALGQRKPKNPRHPI